MNNIKILAFKLIDTLDEIHLVGKCDKLTDLVNARIELTKAVNTISDESIGPTSRSNPGELLKVIYVDLKKLQELHRTSTIKNFDMVARECVDLWISKIENYK